jgi:uncharacterized protein
MAIHRHKHSHASKGHAEHSAKSTAKDNKKGEGGGSVVVDGTGAAQPGGSCMVSGARPGVDGTYRIESVKHALDKTSGWVTTLGLKNPSGTAGKDTRKAKSAKTSSSSSSSSSSDGESAANF